MGQKNGSGVLSNTPDPFEFSTPLNFPDPFEFSPFEFSTPLNFPLNFPRFKPIFGGFDSSSATPCANRSAEMRHDQKTFHRN
jgi:hypothetical protein